MNKKIKPFLDVFIIILLFVVSSYLIKSNIDYFRNTIGDGIFSMLIYVFISILSEVIVPIASVPLIPIASHIWGWPLTAILSIIGWTIGSFIAFMIARIYGVKIVERFVSMKKIQKYEKKIPKEHIFWSIVFIRMVFPVDIVSYVLGLFSEIDTKTFVLATAIGITPFAFLFAYLGNVNIKNLLLVIVLYFVILGIWLFIKKIRNK